MIALLDCNNFYASCERVFNPKLNHEPLVILSNNDGCAIARSNEAKKLGIKMGQPAFEFKRWIDQGIVTTLSSNFTLYGDMSQRVMETIRDSGFEMEVYSIDEAFVYLNTEKEAEDLRKKVLQWTGIPVSIGIAKTKTLAKLANLVAKEEKKVCRLENPIPLLKKTPVDEIWGLGHSYALRLKKSGILSAYDLTQKPDSWIRQKLGVTGLRTALELKGVPAFTEDLPEIKQSISCTRTFKSPVLELNELENLTSEFTARACVKLRRQNSFARGLNLFITSSRFHGEYYANSCFAALPTASSYTPHFIALAKSALKKIYQEGIHYKKLGVTLTDFSAPDAYQEDLFAATPKLRKNLSETLDQINRKYDKKALFFAAEGIKKGAHSLREKLSPRYTTSWEDLPKVK